MFKKIICILLSMLLVLSFTACGSKNNSKDSNNTESKVENGNKETKDDNKENNNKVNRKAMSSEEVVEYLKTAKNGDTFTMGVYEQDNKTKNGAEPIEWIVLDREAGKSLILSKYVLDYKYYQEYDKDEDYRWVTSLWPESSIRNWLNEEFYSTAFTDEEQALILEVTNTVVYSKDYQPAYADSLDKVFLLSCDEEARYVDKVGTIAYGIPTEKVAVEKPYMSDINNVEGITQSMSWWLRDPGFDSLCYAAQVPGYQTLYTPNGNNVASRAGIRPAMWIIWDEAIMTSYANDDLSKLPEDEELNAKLQNAKVGDVITLGMADIDPWAYNGYETVDWKVVDETEEALLLMMNRPYDGHRFMEHEDEVEDETTIYWATSDLRTYLNEEVYNNYFNDYERARILLTSHSTCGDDQWNREGGPDTDDYIFIPDQEEMKKYTTVEERAQLQLTYWLRSPSFAVPYFATVEPNGEFGSDECYDFNEVVAMMWVKK